MKLRPKSKADLIAWKGGATLYRAVLAHESKKSDESKRLFKKSIELFAEARKLNSQSVGVAAVSGGSLVVLADRLPKEYRKTAWSEAYNNYQVLWKQQEPVLDKLPLHLRGELLGGLAQTSQRTGRKKELDRFLDKILETLPNTSYERVAKQWKKDPTIAFKTSISCKSCHSAGRLKARIAKLKDK